MLIVSTDKVLSEALKVMLLENGFGDICICDELPENHGFALVDLDSVKEQVHSENTLTLSADRKKGADILRPFLESELVKAVNMLCQGKREELRAIGDAAHLTDKGFVYKGRRIELTEAEMKVFALLYRREGKCVSYDEIRSVISDRDGAESAMTVYITRLRKKLDYAFGERLIYNLRGRGYTLTLDKKGDRF